ncbi:response regulator, partial [uncultured Aquincola sp.]|uniref:response regulator n=1 Tax=uncultured Aquincola sp. TaxID=886556 RepID=UPI0032B119F4
GTATLRLLLVGLGSEQRPALLGAAKALGWQTDECASASAQAAGRMALADVLVIDPAPAPAEAAPALLQQWRAVLPAPGEPALVLVSAGDAAAGEGTADAAAGEGTADAVLAEPVTAAALFNAVNQALARHGRSGPLLAATRLDGQSLRWLPGVRVMVVDDSELNLEVARRLLEREGAEVLAHVNGREALDQLRRRPDIDLVLMDVQMPVMDGLEATRRLRRDPALARLPVVALTAGAMLAERQRVFDAGMNDFLSKPVEAQALVRCVRRHVERARGRALPVVAGDGIGLPADWPEVPGIDAAGAAVRLGGDAGLFASLLERMLRDFSDLAQPPATTPDAPALAARLHKLRGTAATLGADEVQRLAGQAEQAAVATPSSLLAALQSLATALARLEGQARPLLRQWQARREVQASAAAPGRAEADDAPDTESLQQLVALLRLQDLTALPRFQARAAALQGALGPTRFHELAAHIEALDFDPAADLIQALLDAGDRGGA